MYGFLYLSVLGLFSWLLYFLFLKPAPSCFDTRQNGSETGVDCGGDCVACEVKALAPLDITAPRLFFVGDQAQLVAEIYNSNLTHGSSQVRYKIMLYDNADATVGTLLRQLFIYPGERKFIVETNIDNRQRVVRRAEIVIESVGWQAVSEFAKPAVEIQNQTAALEQNIFIVSGEVKNNNNFVIQEAEIAGTAANQQGILLGVSKTKLDRLQPLEVREFKMFIAIPEDQISALDSDRTSIVLSAKK